MTAAPAFLVALGANVVLARALGSVAMLLVLLLTGVPAESVVRPSDSAWHALRRQRSPPRVADIAVNGDTIAAIGDLDGAAGSRRSTHGASRSHPALSTCSAGQLNHCSWTAARRVTSDRASHSR